MSTIRAEQAGREYTFVLSNNGLRVEFGGSEIFRHWPDTAPTDPAPTDPVPTDPAPEDPAPSDPDPAPTDPSPVPSPPIVGTGNAFGTPELLAALKVAKAGDVIVAKKGYAYEGFAVSGIRPTGEVTILGEAGARWGQVRIDASSENLRLFGLDFELASQPVLGKATPFFVQSSPDTSRIIVDACRFKSRADADAYPTWDLQTWTAWRMGGALLDGPDSIIQDCTGTALNSGFLIGGLRGAILRNSLAGVSRDAHRITDSYGVVEDNTVIDMVYINDGNHTDPLQFFKVGDGLLIGIRVRRNDFRAHVNIVGNPLAAMKCQGIGGYNSPDGNGGTVTTTFDDLIVEDNVVEATAWTGMSFAINRDAVIQRNTVRDTLGRTDGHAMFRIGGGCVNTDVLNNTAPRFNIAAGARQAGNVVA